MCVGEIATQTVQKEIITIILTLAAPINFSVLKRTTPKGDKECM